MLNTHQIHDIDLCIFHKTLLSESEESVEKQKSVKKASFLMAVVTDYLSK